LTPEAFTRQKCISISKQLLNPGRLRGRVLDKERD
jgi:hypothetical protein